MSGQAPGRAPDSGENSDRVIAAGESGAITGTPAGILAAILFVGFKAYLDPAIILHATLFHPTLRPVVGLFLTLVGQIL